MDIIFVHGYNVTSTKTYGLLPKRLKAAGHTIKNIYLSKYVTLDDDITISDIIRAFDSALKDTYKSQYGKKKFACITHSTGGLVVRGWFDLVGGPLTHLVMLTPPNNGSRLANVGKSRLSRLRSLWGSEVGVKVLDALELGSKFQWDLNSNWINKKLYSKAGFFPFVITGQAIDKKMWDVIIPGTSERGSDGVVRAASANLNMLKFAVQSNGSSKSQQMKGVPFLVVPNTSHTGSEMGMMWTEAAVQSLLQALKIKTRRAYNQLEADFSVKTFEMQRRDRHTDGTPLGRFSQIVFRVVDNQGHELSDYAIEIIDASKSGDKLPGGFHRDHHKNEINPEQFNYYLDYDQLMKVKGGELGFRVQSTPDSPMVAYEECMFTTKVTHLIKPNQTTLIEVVLNRRINKNVFRITKNLGYQKVPKKPSRNWTL